MNEVVIAVAGAGKTKRIADSVTSAVDKGRVLVLTYTVRNQLEDASRIAAKQCCDHECPDVMGWMGFLLNHIIRPYLPLLYPEVELRGLGIDPDTFMYLKGVDRYFNAAGDAYPGTLAKLAIDVVKASGMRPIKRLELIYDAVYIDEAQDLRGNDLEIVRALFKSNIDVTIVCDPRQSVLSTSKHDQKHKQYKGVGVVSFYRDMEQKKLCSISDMNETHRFTPEIANFSDLIILKELGFSKTLSKVCSNEAHQGIFVIDMSEIQTYSSLYGATILRNDVRAGEFSGFDVANFGECKGMQRDHVVIVATQAILSFIAKGKRLSEESMCKFYVAVTRARYSVAIAADDPAKLMKSLATEKSPFFGCGLKRWVKFE